MRIKRGVTKSRNHKKIINLAKGYRGTYGSLFKRSNEAVLHAGQYSFDHRRQRRSQLKGNWLNAINAALDSHNISYSKFVSKLHQSGSNLNTKVLAEMAINFPADFDELVKSVA